ncbi:MAG: protein kinase [Gemmatimonadaceae bacterium]|nr:protein kinase [Gemmatimonadaceae bacterium]
MSDQKICPTCGTEYPLSERFCPRDGTALRQANAQADLLGSIVAERYHILKKLGEGGMGTVYLAEHVKMGRKSALKVMNPGMNTDPDAIARFNREASNASRLSHPNICGIYDFGETPDGLIYLAMEFIEGQALTALIEKGGALQPARAASIIHQTADALQIAHDAGIVHRDLKPDNIMIAKTRDGSDLVKVVDFGIAKASSSDAQKVTKTGLVVGTPEYMSPEQLAGDKLDGRSDTYSLALVAFNCLTGKLPFPAETVQESMIMRLTDRPRYLAEVRPDIDWPAELQATLDTALARDAAERYMSAAQFGREFAAAIANMPATMAAEAGTQVVGAQQLPKTKVTRPSGHNTVPMSAVDAPAPKRAGAGAGATRAQAASVATAEKKGLSPAVKFGGPAVAIFASLTAVWITMNGPKKPDPGSQTAPAANETTTVAKSDTGVGATSTPTNGGTTTDPGTKSGTTSNPPAGPNRPVVSNPTPGGTKAPPVSGPPAADPAPTTIVTDAWLSRANSTLASIAERSTRTRADSTEVNRILRELEASDGKLTGAVLARRWEVALVAYGILEDEAQSCSAAAKVLALSQRSEALTMARAVDSACRQ